MLAAVFPAAAPRRNASQVKISSMPSLTNAVPSAATDAPAWRRWALTACMFLSVARFGFLEPFVPLYLELSGLKRGQIGLGFRYRRGTGAADSADAGAFIRTAWTHAAR